MAYLTKEQLDSMGFASLGQNLKISTNASFYNTKYIHLSSNIRIDDFSVISAGEGGIYIGNYVHIAVFSSLIGSKKILIDDFCNISSRVSIYSNNDDYSGEYMTNPLIPEPYTNVIREEVIFEKHVIIGSGSVILPGVILKQGVAIGAMSLIKSDCESFSIYGGNPAKYISQRSRNLLDLENKFLNR